MTGILFDFNGTMFFDSPNHEEAWNAMSKQYRGRALEGNELDYLHGQTNKRIIELLFNETDEEKSAALSKEKEAFYRDVCLQHPDTFHLVDGLPELLDKLKKEGIPMTICSASIKDNIDFFIQSFQLERWFDTSKIIYDDGKHKNKISMFQDGASQIGVALNACVVFEDSLSGIGFAHDCHVKKIIAITTPDKKEEYLTTLPVDEVIYDYKGFSLSQLNM